jgi:hypothetical protein
MGFNSKQLTELEDKLRMAENILKSKMAIC